MGIIASRLHEAVNPKSQKKTDYYIHIESGAGLDALTGLYNRRRGREYLSHMLEDKDGPVIVAIFNLDNFRRINESYGYDVGDEVLKKLACLLRDMAGKGLIVSRWGGEEFMLAFKGMDERAVTARLNALQNAVKNINFVLDDEEFTVTITIGAASYDGGMSMDGLLKLAAERLKRGKEAGRDRIVM